MKKIILATLLIFNHTSLIYCAADLAGAKTTLEEAFLYLELRGIEKHFAKIALKRQTGSSKQYNDALAKAHKVYNCSCSTKFDYCITENPARDLQSLLKQRLTLVRQEMLANTECTRIELLAHPYIQSIMSPEGLKKIFFERDLLFGTSEGCNIDNMKRKVKEAQAKFFEAAHNLESKPETQLSLTNNVNVELERKFKEFKPPLDLTSCRQIFSEEFDNIT